MDRLVQRRHFSRRHCVHFNGISASEIVEIRRSKDPTPTMPINPANNLRINRLRSSIHESFEIKTSMDLFREEQQRSALSSILSSDVWGRPPGDIING